MNLRFTKGKRIISIQYSILIALSDFKSLISFNLYNNYMLHVKSVGKYSYINFLYQKALISHAINPLDDHVFRK